MPSARHKRHERSADQNGKGQRAVHGHVPIERVGHKLANRGHKDHCHGKRTIYHRDGERSLLWGQKLRDVRHAHGEQRTRDRAQDDARDKQHLEVGRQRHDQVAEHKDDAIAHEQLVAAKTPRAERKHRRRDGVDKRKHADELARSGKRYAEFRRQVTFDADDHEFGATERESQQHEQRQAELGARGGERGGG